MKRTLALITCIAMVLTLCACGPSRPSAQSVVEDTIHAVINNDASIGSTFYGVEDTSDKSDTTDSLSEETLARFVQGITYTVVSASEDEKAGTAVVTVEVTNVDLAGVMADTIAELFSYLLGFIFMPEDAQPTDEQTAQKMEEIINTLLDDTDIATVTTTVDVKLSLVDDAWVIDNKYELGDALYGNMLSYMDALNEDGEEATGTKYDTEGILGDHAVKINDIKIAKDAEDDPMVVVNYTWINNSSDTTSAGSQLMTQVFQNGVSMDPTWSWDGKYENNEYTDVRPGTTLEVQTLFKLNNTTDPIEVEISSLDWNNTDAVIRTFQLAE